MKKLTALISALVLLLSLCACSAQTGGAGSADASPEAASQAAGGDVSQGDKDPGKEPPVTPVAERDTPEPNVPIEPNVEPQPPAGSAEISAPAPDSVPALPPTSAPTPPPPPAPEPDPDPVPPPAPEEPVPPAADPKTVAQNLIGHPVSELYAAIGRPISSDYAPGCLEPDSEDGELIYSGFTVYTVRTATREYVYDVL